MSTVSFQSRRAKNQENDTTDPFEAESAHLSQPVHSALSALWMSVLKVSSVQSDDNFFQLGGTSLHAMLIASRVETQLDSEMSLVDFFRDPTFKGLCQSVTPLETGA